MNELFGVFQSKMIVFFLYQLGHNGQLFEHTCHELNLVVKIKKEEIISSCISTRTPDCINSHSTRID